MSTLVIKPSPHLERRTTTLQAISWNVGIRSYAWSPPTDVYETDASFVVRIEAAGMSEADFTIEVDGQILNVSGVRIDSQERRAYMQMEIRFGEFNTNAELPAGVDTQRAEADYKDGFLTIVFPKIKPTGITIRG
jgi:HSP20 family protein